PTTPLCSPYPRTPPTPKAPLFPYTTLFRSRRLRAPDRPHRARAKRGRRVHFDEWGRTARTSGNRAVHRTKNSTTQAREFSLHLQDRKSTRLNSSHVSISYAVFCLKKKNKTR